MASLSFGSPVRLTSGPGVDLRPNWTPDSRSVVFERWLGVTRGLFQVLGDGTGLTELTLCNLPGTHATGRPAFFGVGDFAFVSDRRGHPGLYRCTLADGAVTPLVQADQACQGPSLAVTGNRHPDQPTLLYFQQAGDQTFHIHQRSAQGQTRQVTDAPGSQDQPWLLPDARSFVYHAHEDGQHLIYFQSLTHDAPRTCLSSADESTPYVTPFPSPDGQWVAFCSASSGMAQVWVMRLDGTARQQVTDGETHRFPAWRPDGQALVVVCGDPLAEQPSGELWTIPVG